MQGFMVENKKFGYRTSVGVHIFLCSCFFGSVHPTPYLTPPSYRDGGTIPVLPLLDLTWTVAQWILKSALDGPHRFLPPRAALTSVSPALFPPHSPKASPHIPPLLVTSPDLPFSPSGPFSLPSLSRRQTRNYSTLSLSCVPPFNVFPPRLDETQTPCWNLCSLPAQAFAHPWCRALTSQTAVSTFLTPSFCSHRSPCPGCCCGLSTYSSTF